MNLLDALRGLYRRWYITIPGLILAAAAAYGAWQVTPPQYERSASQLMLPGKGLLPEGATNRFLYIGGLSPVADVLVRSVSGDEALTNLLEAHPGAQIEVLRDTTASGPVVMVVVTATDDAQVAPLIQDVLVLTSETLERLQREEGVPVRDRVTLSTLAVSQESTVRTRDRLVTSAAAGVVVVLVTIVLASVVDGLVTRSRGRANGAKGSKRQGTENVRQRSATAEDEASEVSSSTMSPEDGLLQTELFRDGTLFDVDAPRSLGVSFDDDPPSGGDVRRDDVFDRASSQDVRGALEHRVK